MEKISITRHFYKEGKIPDFYIFPGLKLTEIKGKGLGIVTTTDLIKNQIIECCPVLLLSPDKHLSKDWARLHKTMLETIFTDYIFDWKPKYGAVALGYGGLYNHSSKPNADVIRITKHRRMVIIANQDIEEGTEVTFTYRSVWFQPIENDTGVSPTGNNNRS